MRPEPRWFVCCKARTKSTLHAVRKKQASVFLRLTLITVPNPLRKSLLGAGYSSKGRESQGVGALRPSDLY